VERRIAGDLRRVADEAYPGRIRPFFLQIVPKESRSAHGNYNRKNHTLRIFNLSRRTSYIAATAIHELAHHCDCCLRGKTGHDAGFYEVYRNLMTTAVRLKIVDYEDACKESSVTMKESSAREFAASMSAGLPADPDLGRTRHLIRVRDAFAIKDDLKDREYRWSEAEMCWCREVEAHQVEEETEFIRHLGAYQGVTCPVSVLPVEEAGFDAAYHVVVENGYERRAELRGAGYLFNGYNFTGSVWVKRIRASDLGAEQKFLLALKCKHKVATRPGQKIRTQRG